MFEEYLAIDGVPRGEFAWDSTKETIVYRTLSGDLFRYEGPKDKL